MMCQINEILKHIKTAIKNSQGEVTTLKEMANRIGLEESALSRRLKTTPGRKDELTLKEFLKIAKVLNIDPALLLNPNTDIESTNILRDTLKSIVKELMEEESKKQT